MTDETSSEELIKKVNRQSLSLKTLSVIAFSVLVLFNIVILAKLTVDDDRKFQVLRSNQNQLICIVRESTNPVHTIIDPKTFKFTVDNSYIDSCIKANQ